MRTVSASKKSIYLYKNIELTSAERAPGTVLSSTADKDAKTTFIMVAVLFAKIIYDAHRDPTIDRKRIQAATRRIGM